MALPALFAVVLGSGASRFLVAHNHPGGTARPSDGDLLVTRRIRAAALLLGLTFAATSRERDLFMNRSYQTTRVATMVEEWLETQNGEPVELRWAPDAMRIHRRDHMTIVFRTRSGGKEGLVDAWYAGEDEFAYRWQVLYSWDSGRLGAWPLDPAAIKTMLDGHPGT